MSIQRKVIAVIVALFSFVQITAAQQEGDSAAPTSKWSFHFQTTIIAQKHSGFKSLYRGDNSLADTVEPTAQSLTATLFIGRKLWKGATFYFNPEVSGGKGLSSAAGVAGALNGETYRVGAVQPQVFIARAFLQQYFALGNSYEDVSEDVNQVAGRVPSSRIVISAGKFAIADFYDNNAYGKDPRTQFFNWSVWANGAWDYPANTRGYTEGLVVELIKPRYAIRISSVAVPRIANYHLMEYNINAHSETLEYEHKLQFGKRTGRIRLMASSTYSKAPSYQQGINSITSKDTFLLNVIRGVSENTSYGGHKYGLGLNIDQQLSNDLGFFCRVGWNDGKYVTWAFTEIDRTLSGGLVLKGTKWKRRDDVWGVAGVVNGISSDHRNFLEAGGYGFIIGDGALHYGHEGILETYYNAQINRFFQITFDYQFVNNPGYNKDRGPVHVFGVRGHIMF
ncbi:MAG: carbohydrate porin [Chitinophaga sp.]|uniref:carbohydrate porin n=1 Tax=Chitinophaga sp. TaxID=1869181 RepID=UPI0025C0653F|nr:carbohydrate porin [Chitinophaga sp.]MBV8252007.1 carbohydrate porin [Chitinophaga sp.]